MTKQDPASDQFSGTRTVGRTTGLALCGLGILAVLVLLGLAVGADQLSPGQVWNALWHDDGRASTIIVRQLRLPRTVLAIVVGAALGAAGVLMQALTRNPLAEPGVLGVHAGGSLAVVLAIAVLGITDPNGYIWFAVVGAGVAAFAVYLLGAGAAAFGDHTRLLLAGVALSATLGACTGVITMFDSDTFDSYRFWVVGSLTGRGSGVLDVVVPFVAVGLVLALAVGRHLNALALGDDTATALGVPLVWVRLGGFAAITILCGAATAAAGPISFVGLVVHHALRLVLGQDTRKILLGSLIAGPILVLGSDIVGRVIAPPGEIDVGIVTAFVGAPVLLALVLRSRAPHRGRTSRAGNSRGLGSARGRP